MNTVLITGGTGMIGKALTHQLVEKGYKVIVLTRDDSRLHASPAVKYAKWDVDKGVIDKRAIMEADCIVHLAGEGIADKRWTKKRKKLIVESRVNSAKLLVKALKEIPNRISAVISASAIGWYGPDLVVPNPRPFREEAVMPAKNGSPPPRTVLN
jgi:NAD dependent epimerase/dehydratase family enzyme